MFTIYFFMSEAILMAGKKPFNAVASVGHPSPPALSLSLLAASGNRRASIPFNPDHRPAEYLRFATHLDTQRYLWNDWSLARLRTR